MSVDSLTNTRLGWLRDQARARAKNMRSVARYVSNAPIKGEGDSVRERRRRADLVANLHTMAQSADRMAQGFEITEMTEGRLDEGLIASAAAFRRGDWEGGMMVIRSYGPAIHDIITPLPVIPLRSSVMSLRQYKLDTVARQVEPYKPDVAAKLMQLSKRADNPDWDEDAAHLASAVDAVLDEALMEFQMGNTQQGIDLVVGSLATVDGLLRALGAPDADEPDEGGASGTNARRPIGGIRSVVAAEVIPLFPTKLKDGYRSMDVRMQARAGRAADAAPVMEGNFAVFNEWTEINDIWEGTFMERVAPGAFAQTFAEDRDEMRVLFQHGRDAMMGSKVLGPIDTVEETKDGAHYVVPLFRGIPEIIIEGLEAGQYGASFRFEALGESWNDRPKPSDYNPRGLPERTLTQLRVGEFGPVTFPAYSSASAGLRSRSLTSKFYMVSAGRPGAGSAGGGSDARGTVSDVQQAELEARHRELRMQGVIR